MRFAGLLAFPLLFVAVSGAHTQSRTLTLDVIVTHPDGRPVTDLRPADLVVRLDGKPAPITSIRPVVPAGAATRPVFAEPYSTNTLVAGRTTAVVVDVARLAADRTAPMRTGLAQLAGALSSADRLALIPLAGDARPVDFTLSHQRVVDAAGALPIGGGAPRTARQDETAVETMLGAAGRAATMLGDEPGIKTLLVITEPFAITTRLRRAIQTLGELAARHRVALYVAAPGTATVPLTNGLHALAVGTGGALVVDSWTMVASQERGRVELTLAVDDDVKSGEPIRLLIGTSRPNLSVRARPAAFVETADAPALASLTDMLRQARTFSDLPLRAEAFPVLHADRSSIRLLIVGETMDPSRALAWSEFALVSPDGRVVTQWTEAREALAHRPLISGALAPEGQYRLRWAASELSGRRGTVDIDVTAKFTPAGPFQLSALMLGRLASDTFVTELQPSGPDVEWYAETYGALGDGVTLTTRLDVLAAPAGAPLITEPGRVLTSPDATRRAITGRVNIAALPDGDYQFRATLIVNGQDAGFVTRTFRKVR